jgi:hypothetical protein
LQRDRHRLLTQRQRDLNYVEPWSPETERRNAELDAAWQRFQPTWERNQRRLGAKPMVLYFVQEGDGGPVKIGLATSMARRFKTMQTGNSTKLHLLGCWPTTELDPSAETPREVESAIHRQFAHLRLRGEWFAPTDELLGFIGRLILHSATV